ncbi:hypothetical protein L0F63_003997 [Massospora cicadina]|nr:hypothetical protein L0F63_003997 [Massospora cicadina]
MMAKVGGSFGDLGMALYGNWARHLVLVSIVLSQFGFCCAYMIFIAKNLQDVFYGVTECRYLVSESWFFIVQLLVYIPVALLRKIKSLSAIAIVADGFIILGLVYLVGYNLVHISNYGPGVVQNFNREGFTLFIGTAIFTFEGIGLIIPIVESMKEPEKFPAILAWTMVGFTALYLFVGSLSYATFGGEVRTVVLSNLPQGTVASACIQTMYALAIVLSVPLQFFPIIGILEAGLFTRSGRGSLLVKWQKNIFRLMIVLSTAAVAWLGASSLDHIVSIVGSLCCIPLSFIYPAIFHLKAFPNVSYAQKIKDISIVVAGFLLMIYVSLQTLANWNTSGEGAISPCTPPSH